jgi:hypothetical protein
MSKPAYPLLPPKLELNLRQELAPFEIMNSINLSEFRFGGQRSQELTAYPTFT